MLALLDGDIFAYRCAAASEQDPLEIALFRVRDSIEQTLDTVGADNFQVWLSDKRENNFRLSIYPEYKANRTQPKPVHLDAVKDYLVKEWGANIALGQEADDALGIEQSKCFHDDTVVLDTIICSIDKDLKQIPGRHYNFVKQEFDEIAPIEGTRFFYKQLLIGDTADNVRGVYGIGRVKAGKILDHLADPWDMYDACLTAYGGDSDRLLVTGRVLYIRQKPNELWEPPWNGTKPDQDSPQLSLPLNLDKNEATSEPT